MTRPQSEGTALVEAGAETRHEHAHLPEEIRTLAAQLLKGFENAQYQWEEAGRLEYSRKADLDRFFPAPEFDQFLDLLVSEGFTKELDGLIGSLPVESRKIRNVLRLFLERKDKEPLRALMKKIRCNGGGVSPRLEGLIRGSLEGTIHGIGGTESTDIEVAASGYLRLPSTRSASLEEVGFALGKKATTGGRYFGFTSEGLVNMLFYSIGIEDEPIVNNANELLTQILRNKRQRELGKKPDAATYPGFELKKPEIEKAPNLKAEMKGILLRAFAQAEAIKSGSGKTALISELGVTESEGFDHVQNLSEENKWGFTRWVRGTNEKLERAQKIRDGVADPGAVEIYQAYQIAHFYRTLGLKLIKVPATHARGLQMLALAKRISMQAAEQIPVREVMLSVKMDLAEANLSNLGEAVAALRSLANDPLGREADRVLGEIKGRAAAAIEVDSWGEGSR